MKNQFSRYGVLLSPACLPTWREPLVKFLYCIERLLSSYSRFITLSNIISSSISITTFTRRVQNEKRGSSTSGEVSEVRLESLELDMS